MKREFVQLTLLLRECRVVVEALQELQKLTPDSGLAIEAEMVRKKVEMVAGWRHD